ncbi:MAG: isoprenylcysteine carboxylmethyltransferase family protein [Armatimonadetes bacterium]|nr:isoprenylcysteine carboxylmethyltransferase family protein [Armatimonadota bacterium]
MPLAPGSLAGYEEHLFAIAARVVSACFGLLMLAVLYNFATAERSGTVREERRSPVATGTMTLFFVGVYLLIHHRLGVLPLANPALGIAVSVAGMLLVAGGCATNLLGRLALGRNWANQVVVYEAQTLVTHGVFGWVRHPLYASLMAMSYGAGLAFHNLAAVAATACVFVPMMHYRASQEEALLEARFPEYAAYRARTGKFFPRGRGDGS